ncbi:MAG: hypothetical protein HY719_07295 [Planctomycetes bacterium]|nr:hypothetical protein [Planctomycetota bacterium]
MPLAAISSTGGIVAALAAAAVIALFLAAALRRLLRGGWRAGADLDGGDSPPAVVAPAPAPAGGGGSGESPSADDLIDLLDSLDETMRLPHERGVDPAAPLGERLRTSINEEDRPAFFLRYVARSRKFGADEVGTLTIAKNILDSLAAPVSAREAAERCWELFRVYDFSDQVTWKWVLKVLELAGFVARREEEAGEVLSRTALGARLLRAVNERLGFESAGEERESAG